MNSACPGDVSKVRLSASQKTKTWPTSLPRTLARKASQPVSACRRWMSLVQNPCRNFARSAPVMRTCVRSLNVHHACALGQRLVLPPRWFRHRRLHRLLLHAVCAGSRRSPASSKKPGS